MFRFVLCVEIFVLRRQNVLFKHCLQNAA